MFYYSDLFKNVAPNNGFAYGAGISIGLMTQLARFAFGVSGAFEFAKGLYAKGAGGLLFSFCITLFESFEVQSIAAKWSGGDVHLFDAMFLLFQFLIWTGFCLELRLAMNVSGNDDDGNLSGKNSSPSTVKSKKKQVSFSSNGAN